jgi:hypothetical protein
MTGLEEIERSEGDNLGPDPGKGAVIHSSMGEADFDALPGGALPPKKDVQKDQPFPLEHAGA